MRFHLLSLTLIIVFEYVSCQKSSYPSESKIPGTGVKEKNSTNPPQNPLISNTKYGYGLACPEEGTVVPVLPLPCQSHEECYIMGPRMLCCSKKCVKGVKIKKNPTSTTTTTTIAPSTAKKINFQTPIPSSTTSTTKSYENVKISNTKLETRTLGCPDKEVISKLFSFPCQNERDCAVMGNDHLCCFNKCSRGIELSQTATSSSSSPTRSSNNLVEIPVETTKPPKGSHSNSQNFQNFQTLDAPLLVCPGPEVRVPFFSQRCSVKTDCYMRNMLCCSGRCMKGVVPPKPESKHTPSWFGLVERHCPIDPIAEILEIKECESDLDCGPRICCQDKYKNNSDGAVKSYCRTPQPSIERFPVANRLIMEPFKVFASYMQCTPPPPPLLDLFPKACKNTLDCFPNLCCQENGKKYCRPPKRSLLSFVAGVGQRLVPMDAARKLIERLN